MTIEKAMNVFRQLQSRSHSFASAFGSLSAAVTITILPSLAISIRGFSTPAARAARMARVMSDCRKVEGARAMATTVNFAYEASPEVIQPVAGRPECWPAAEEVGDVEVIGGGGYDGGRCLVRSRGGQLFSCAHPPGSW